MIYHNLNKVNKQEFLSELKASKNSTLLGLDYGVKKIGLAVCDFAIGIPTPLKNISNNECIRLLQDIISDYNVVALIAGVSALSQEQAESKRSEMIAFLVKCDIYHLPIFFVSEESTSRYADEILKEANLRRKRRNAIDDSIAAMIILQNFLNL
jgi:putative holliday junction resolvase